MSAALAELIRIGLVTEDSSNGTICAVPLEAAISMLSIRNYPEGVAEMPYLSGGRRASKLNWTQPPDSVKLKQVCLCEKLHTLHPYTLYTIFIESSRLERWNRLV